MKLLLVLGLITLCLADSCDNSEYPKWYCGSHEVVKPSFNYGTCVSINSLAGASNAASDLGCGSKYAAYINNNSKVCSNTVNFNKLAAYVNSNKALRILNSKCTQINAQGNRTDPLFINYSGGCSCDVPLLTPQCPNVILCDNNTQCQGPDTTTDVYEELWKFKPVAQLEAKLQAILKNPNTTRKGCWGSCQTCPIYIHGPPAGGLGGVFPGSDAFVPDLPFAPWGCGSGYTKWYCLDNCDKVGTGKQPFFCEDYEPADNKDYWNCGSYCPGQGPSNEPLRSGAEGLKVLFPLFILALSLLLA